MSYGITRILSWICHCNPRNLLLVMLIAALETSSWVWTVFNSGLASFATFPSCINHSSHLHDLHIFVLQSSQEDGKDIMKIFWYGCYLLKIQKGYKSGIKNDWDKREYKDNFLMLTFISALIHFISLLLQLPLPNLYYTYVLH